jgi:transcriptional regulator with XRE-family HTH domain
MSDGAVGGTAGGVELPPFSEWLSTAMRQRGLSQAEVARRIGVDDAQVSRWRRGLVVPSVGHLQRIADALDVPRVFLDRLAGYPVPDEADVLLPEPEPAESTPGPERRADPDRSQLDRDPALATEVDAYAAWFARLLERRIPPVLWRSYASACLALADGLAGGYADALDEARGARREARGNE